MMDWRACCRRKRKLVEHGGLYRFVHRKLVHQISHLRICEKTNTVHSSTTIG